MFRIIVSIFLIFSALQINCLAQSDSLNFNDSTKHHSYFEKKVCLITGYQIHKNHIGELGLGIIKNGVVGHHPSTMIYGISNEFNLNNDFVWGQKIGIWFSGGMCLGLNLINYTNLKSNAIRFRPEYGFGFNIFRVVYGYNFTITNKEFENINKHIFQINIMINLKHLKTIKK